MALLADTCRPFLHTYAADDLDKYKWADVNAEAKAWREAYWLQDRELKKQIGQLWWALSYVSIGTSGTALDPADAARFFQAIKLPQVQLETTVAASNIVQYTSAASIVYMVLLLVRIQRAWTSRRVILLEGVTRFGREFVQKETGQVVPGANKDKDK